MHRAILIPLAVVVAVQGRMAELATLGAKDPDGKPEAGKADTKRESSAITKTPIAVKPKPLSEPVKKGLAYLVSQQQKNGGWGQGGGWRVAADGGRAEGEDVKDPPDLSNTCIATLALLRAGHTPTHGEYAKNLSTAMEFICSRIEKADKDSLYVTDIRDTQLQSKLGPYVDTFLASWALAEMKDSLPTEKDEKRLAGALDKVIAKIERHQRKDGTWAHDDGWAPILCQALACKALNRTRQVGCKVNDMTLARAEKYATTNFDEITGTFGAPGLGLGGLGGGGLGFGGGGVPLYTQSGQLGGLQSSINTNRQVRDSVRQVVNSKTAPKEEKAKAQDQLRRFEEAEKVQEKAAQSILKQIDDKEFMKGFGSNGGEEFLSYMNISELLLPKGDKDWKRWDKQVSDNLNRIQNKDGSWVGEHCITGRTFCTASALLVLMADRAPAPVAAKK